MWTYTTFENNIVINHEFTKFLKLWIRFWSTFPDTNILQSAPVGQQLGSQIPILEKLLSYCSVHRYSSGTKQLSWLGVGLVIRGLLVRFLAGALWSVLGQDSLFHIASVYPAAKWVPSTNKAVLRACALYAASCSGISPGDWNGFRVYRPDRGGRSCELFGGYKTINRIPLPLKSSGHFWALQAYATLIVPSFRSLFVENKHRCFQHDQG